MSELLELTDRELDAVGGGRLNNFNPGNIQFFNTGGAGGAGGAGGIGGGGGNGGNGGNVFATQIGQQSSYLSLNGLYFF